MMAKLIAIGLRNKYIKLKTRDTYSVICVDCIIFSNTSIATKGLFSTRSGNLLGVKPTW